MKKTKIALTLVCAILLVAASVMGTLAYLTSTPAAVTNTFTVGTDVTITLDETKTDANGKPVTPAAKTNGNEYKLMPGHTYTKDPTVHVTGEDCYVFVTVDNGIAAIEASTNTIASQITNATHGWRKVDGYTNLYVYTNNTDTPVVCDTGDDLKVFSTFTIDGTKTHDDLDDYATTTTNNVNITIKAYAIQADGMTGKTAAQIWALIGATGAITESGT